MHTLDIIGTLTTPLVTDSEGVVVSGGELLPGFHVNTIPSVQEWIPYKVIPTNKRRVFAGMEEETCCYVFPSEEDFLIKQSELLATE